MRILRFLFGSGWGALWHLCVYGLVLFFPLHFAAELLQYAREGGGPAGLGVLGFLVLEAVLVGSVSLASSLVYVRKLPVKPGQKAGIVFGAVLLLPLAVFFAGVPLGDGKVWGFWLCYGAIFGALGLNLWWLDRAREGGR